MQNVSIKKKQDINSSCEEEGIMIVIQKAVDILYVFLLLELRQPTCICPTN